MLPGVHALRRKRTGGGQQNRKGAGLPESRLLVLRRQDIQLFGRQDIDIHGGNRGVALHSGRQLLPEEHPMPLFQVLLLSKCWIHHIRQGEHESGEDFKHLQWVYHWMLFAHQQVRNRNASEGSRRWEDPAAVCGHVLGFSALWDPLLLFGDALMMAIHLINLGYWLVDNGSRQT